MGQLRRGSDRPRSTPCHSLLHQQILAGRQPGQAVGEMMRTKVSGSALRAVWRTIACTTASMFLARWLISLRRRLAVFGRQGPLEQIGGLAGQHVEQPQIALAGLHRRLAPMGRQHAEQLAVSRYQRRGLHGADAGTAEISPSSSRLAAISVVGPRRRERSPAHATRSAGAAGGGSRLRLTHSQMMRRLLV